MRQIAVIFQNHFLLYPYHITNDTCPLHIFSSRFWEFDFQIQLRQDQTVSAPGQRQGSECGQSGFDGRIGIIQCIANCCAGFLKQTFGITLPLVVPTAFLVIILEWINAFKIFKEVYFIGGAYPDEAVYTLQNYMNNMYGKLNYQNVTTAAYSFALIVFALFGVLFLTQRRLLKRLSG